MSRLLATGANNSYTTIWPRIGREGTMLRSGCMRGRRPSLSVPAVSSTSDPPDGCRENLDGTRDLPSGGLELEQRRGIRRLRLLQVRDLLESVRVATHVPIGDEDLEDREIGMADGPHRDIEEERMCQTDYRNDPREKLRIDCGGRVKSHVDINRWLGVETAEANLDNLIGSGAMSEEDR